MRTCFSPARACRPIKHVTSLSAIVFIILSLVGDTRAQSTPPTTESGAANVAANNNSTAELESRISRARSLATIGRLGQAAAELEAVRAATTDPTLGEVARVLLMRVLIEMPDYARAENLLTETFQASSNAPDDQTSRNYYTVAGQLMNATRAHIERYRVYGFDITDQSLPTDARNDVERLRLLLERVIEQSRALRQRDASVTDAVALLEDAASVRMNLARNETDRARWQTDIADARRQLLSNATSGAQLGASLRRTSATRNPSASTSNTSSSNQTSSSNPSQQPAPPSSNPSAQPTPSSANTSSGNSSNQNSQQSSGMNQTRDTTAKTPADGQPLEVGSLLERAAKRVTPLYPQTARTSRTTGVVVVHLIIKENGEVEKVMSSRGPELLKRAAEDAARRWRFRPTVIEGQAVRVSGYISFNFAL